MCRLLCFDVGTKRTGIAATDPKQIIASALTTIATKTLLDWLKDYLKQEKVEKIIVGQPLQLNNLPSQSAGFINKIVHQIQKILPSGVKIIRIDERFTSKMASATLVSAGAKKKDRQKKENIDKVSAAIMLQDFLNKSK